MANEIILVSLIFENVCQHHNMRLQSCGWWATGYVDKGLMTTGGVHFM